MLQFPKVDHDCKSCLTAICRQMQQVWEAVPWLEVKRVVAVNHIGVAHCLSMHILAAGTVDMLHVTTLCYGQGTQSERQ